MDTLPTLAGIAAPDDPITFAEQAIKAVADELTGLLRAKGYPNATVEFWIGARRGRPNAWVGRTGEAGDSMTELPYQAMAGASVREIAGKLRAAIAALPDPMADAWQFDPNDPRNQRVEAAP